METPEITYIGEGAEAVVFTLDPEAVSVTVYADGWYNTYY